MVEWPMFNSWMVISDTFLGPYHSPRVVVYDHICWKQQEAINIELIGISGAVLNAKQCGNHSGGIYSEIFFL